MLERELAGIAVTSLVLYMLELRDCLHERCLLACPHPLKHTSPSRPRPPPRRNQDGESVSADHIWIQRTPECSMQQPRQVYSAVPPKEGAGGEGGVLRAYHADAFTFANEARR